MAVASLCACVAVEPVAPAPAVAGAAAGQAESWLIPSPQAGLEMQARVYRPDGTGPFPLAVINHGSEQDPGRRARMPAPEFPELTAWFLKRGYVVVLPTRPGHGATGGRYLEDQGPCRNADYGKAGAATADSIAATVAFMRRQPFVSQDGVVVAGHSAGGWGAIAYAARNPQGVRAVVSFAGGRGGRHLDQPGNTCAPDRLVAAAQSFGHGTRIPSLWLYAQNDSYFPPPLSQAMAAGFSGAQPVQYRLLPAIAGDGHFLIRSNAWQGELAAFLERNR